MKPAWRFRSRRWTCTCGKARTKIRIFPQQRRETSVFGAEIFVDFPSRTPEGRFIRSSFGGSGSYSHTFEIEYSLITKSVYKCTIEALRKILCKRYSTNVKNSAVSCACAGLNSLGRRSPGRALQYARPQGVNAARASPGSLQPGNQPALRSANMISNWLRIRSQFWHRACQCFTIR